MAEQSTSDNATSSSSTAMPAGNCNSSAPVNAEAHHSFFEDHSLQLTPGGLYAPNVGGGILLDDSIAGIVARLMRPPQYLYNNNRQTVTLTINWAVGVAGPERFERRGTDGRYFSCGGDELEEPGEAAGLSSEIMEWLKYGEETLTLRAEHFL